jgi:hypothetical protein
MLTNPTSSLAPEVAVELQAISQALNTLLVEWQEVMAKEGATPAVSTQYYGKAVKLIEQKRALEASLVTGKKHPVPDAPPFEIKNTQAPEAEPAATPAPPVEATANGSPPKKPTKKKAAKVKVSLVMNPETPFAEAPPAPPADVAEAVTAILGKASPPPTPPVIHSYGDGEALADGTLVDVSALKVDVKGTALTRMTATIYARMSQAVQAHAIECVEAQAPFVSVVAERNWIVSQLKQAVIKGDILQVPRTPTSGAIWIMENEGGGFTMLAPSDY